MSHYTSKQSHMVLTGSVGTHDMWIGKTKALARVGNQKEITFLHFEDKKKEKWRNAST